MLTINPRFMDLKAWADQTTGIASRFGFRSKLVDEDWKTWGMHLVYTLGRVKGGQIPRPDQFDDWRLWAIRINQVMQS